MLYLTVLQALLRLYAPLAGHDSDTISIAATVLIEYQDLS
jgi:hypothetical protein